jgi:PAS domain S-box-containing protein
LMKRAMADGAFETEAPVMAIMNDDGPARWRGTPQAHSVPNDRRFRPPVLRVDPNGMVLETNGPGKAQLRMLGRRVGEMLPEYITQLIPGVILTGNKENAIIECKGGEIPLTVTMWHDPDVDIVGMSRSSGPLLVLVDDRVSETSALHALPVGLYTSGRERDRGASWISPGVEELTGYSPSRFTSRVGFWMSKIHPEDRPGVTRGLARIQKGGKASLEYRFLCADGSYHWILDHIVIAPGSKKGHGIMQDIDRRKTSELATLEHNEFLERLMESASHGTVILDEDNCMAFMSPQLAARLGFNASDWVRKRTRMCFHPQDEQAGLEAISSALRGVPGICRARLMGANGTCIHVQLHTSSIQWRGRRLVLCMAGDMSDQVRAEMERTECIGEGIEELVCAALAALAPGTSRKEAMCRIRRHLGVKGNALLETFGGEDK